MIKINNVSKSFGNKEVLNGVNLTLNKGEVLGLIGINGAGKSTLLRLIAGIYKPNFGEVLIDEKNIIDNEAAKRNMFFLPDEPFYGINTTPLSLIDLYKTFYTFDKQAYINRLNELNLPIKKPLKTFSKGMKRQVFISLAFAIKPKYLLLDEAFDGLDPLARLAFKKDLVNLVNEYETTVIISSHSLRELEDICDSYALLDNKKITTSGVIEEDIHKYHKYQLAFENEITEEDIKFDYKSLNIDKRVMKIVTKHDLEEFTSLIQDLKPLIIDEIPIDFEELFIIEVESRGYIK